MNESLESPWLLIPRWSSHGIPSSMPLWWAFPSPSAPRPSSRTQSILFSLPVRSHTIHLSTNLTAIRIRIEFTNVIFLFLICIFFFSSSRRVWQEFDAFGFTLFLRFYRIFFFSLIFLPVDRESRVLVGETASNNFPLIIIVREGGANLCALARTGCVQVENQRASTMPCII